MATLPLKRFYGCLAGVLDGQHQSALEVVITDCKRLDLQQGLPQYKLRVTDGVQTCTAITQLRNPLDSTTLQPGTVLGVNGYVCLKVNGERTLFVTEVSGNASPRPPAPESPTRVKEQAAALDDEEGEAGPFCKRARYSWLFNDPTFSDITLEIHVRDPDPAAQDHHSADNQEPPDSPLLQLTSSMPCPEDSSSPADSHDAAAEPRYRSTGSDDASSYPRRFAAHAVLLAAASQFFRTLLQNWKKGNVIRMEVAWHERHMAEHLIRFIYTQQLLTTNQEDLLTLLILADQYGVQDCIKACCEALCEHLTDWHTILAILTFPACLLTGPHLTRLHAQAVETVVQKFLHLEDAWRNPEYQSQFMQLPLSVVTLLLQRDDLTVVSENSVFIAIASWIQHHSEAGQISQETLSALLDLLRFPYLTSSFITGVLDSTPWFSNSHFSWPFVKAALMYNCSNHAQSTGPGSSGRFTPRSYQREANLTIPCAMSFHHLQNWSRTRQNTGEVCTGALSKEFLHNGFTWRVVIRCTSMANRDASISLGVECKLKAWTQLIPLKNQLQVPLKFEIAVRKKGAQGVQRRGFEGVVDISTSGRGVLWLPDFFGTDDPEDDRCWSDYVHNGKLVLECSILQCM